ncbi:DMT family transporter [Paenibacillus sp. CF384]|uniref:DMT family transporter n=1 Tax=Paenibacillus sp. CF384 TaxID=1884382 RepID=UPI00089828E1|nr:DMT family transporter [Paenibacillus sp. CF384]SDX58265.1 EamA domain-containing membrane protein RarD [Paenibacillus sp. CF384]
MQVSQTKSELSRSPYVLMPILLLLWGSVAAVSKLVLGQLDSYQVLFYMNGIGVVVFAGIVLVKVRWRTLRLWSWRQMALIASCGLFAFLYDALYLQALDRIPAVEASMLNYLFPIFIVIFAIPIHKEKMNRYKLLSVFMGFAGTVLLMTKGDISSMKLTNWIGDVLAILAAVSWGLFTNLVKKNKQDMLISTFFITVVAFVLSAGGLFVYSNLMLPRLVDFGGVFWLSMCNIVLGFFLYFRALRYSPASLIASFTFFTPFVTLVFIMLLLDERLTLMDGLAALLILCSVPVQKLGSMLGSGEKKEEVLS